MVAVAVVVEEINREEKRAELIRLGHLCMIHKVEEMQIIKKV